MQRIQRGDSEALRDLIEIHQNRVAAVALRVGGPGTDVEEVAHQTFLRVWKFAHRYQPTARFTSWLLTITRNILLNEIRYRSRHPTVPLDPAENCESPAHEGLPDPSLIRPDQALLGAELQDAIEGALQKLPETQRTALVLRSFEDLAYEDIAAVLDTTVPSVKSLIFRARTTLKEILRDYLE
jgi:RNA polymerase sigma-70 factor (ECF subfamily)